MIQIVRACLYNAAIFLSNMKETAIFSFLIFTKIGRLLPS
ncbi:hypothetical protein HMPREF9393_1972 [Streptococcus sanguinis SK1056]|uniref:Uncharacterized protein n=1 Tax=Streptococcus sanguinis SK1056 TaxID=888820 RepID=F3UEB8_STRSA|nr:hypothetical protein HMPREF9393_1972 [Streptococcus sanguinis SK1056]